MIREASRGAQFPGESTDAVFDMARVFHDTPTDEDEAWGAAARDVEMDIDEAERIREIVRRLAQVK